MYKKSKVHALTLNYNEHQAIKGIINEISREYSHIKRIIIYGSKTRGDFSEDSDIDLLFITETELSRSLKYQILDRIYNYELKNDIVISALFITESDFNKKVNPFLRQVKKEGIILWWRE